MSECRWYWVPEEPDCEACWETSCGEFHLLGVNDPRCFNFCPYCGNRVLIRTPLTAAEAQAHA
jgi:hypothetical protein